MDENSQKAKRREDEHPEQRTPDTRPAPTGYIEEKPDVMDTFGQRGRDKLDD